MKKEANEAPDFNPPDAPGEMLPHRSLALSLSLSLLFFFARNTDTGASRL